LAWPPTPKDSEIKDREIGDGRKTRRTPDRVEGGGMDNRRGVDNRSTAGQNANSKS
jgi:hypothetical protein